MKGHHESSVSWNSFFFVEKGILFEVRFGLKRTDILYPCQLKVKGHIKAILFHLVEGFIFITFPNNFFSSDKSYIHYTTFLIQFFYRGWVYFLLCLGVFFLFFRCYFSSFLFVFFRCYFFSFLGVIFQLFYLFFFRCYFCSF